MQLSSIDTAHYKGQLWPQFRNEQRKFLTRVSHAGMAVTSDIGDLNSIHPLNKKYAGERLAKWALYDAYAKKIIPSGPLPVKAVYKKGKVEISFNYTGKTLATSNAMPLKGFSTDKDPHPTATINKQKVIIKASSKPTFIYYGWSPFTNGNHY